MLAIRREFLMSQDQLQHEELLIINHHVEDVLIGLETNEHAYIENSLNDIKEAIQRLSKFLVVARIATDI